MCIIVRKSQAQVLTTTEDMFVYKVGVVHVTKGLLSIYQRFAYHLTDVMVAERFDESVKLVEDLASGKLSYWNEDDGPERVTYLHHGFHSFLTPDHAAIMLQHINETLPTSVEYFRDSLTGHRSFKSMEVRRIMRFIVPAGTRYVKGWLSNSENILSEKLKYNAVLVPKYEG
jgi:hypothetical protein